MAPASKNKLFMGKLDQRAEGNQKANLSDKSNCFNVLERPSAGIRLTLPQRLVASCITAMCHCKTPQLSFGPAFGIVSSASSGSAEKHDHTQERNDGAHRQEVAPLCPLCDEEGQCDEGRRHL